MPDFIPSAEQSTFFNTLLSTRSNIVLSAVAGSGKTTTIVQALHLLPKTDPDSFLSTSVLFLAFNKSIADTLRARCPQSVDCSTFHSLGYRALRSSGQWPKDLKVEGWKYNKMLQQSLKSDDPDFRNILTLVSATKSQWPRPDLDEVIRSFDLDFDRLSRAKHLAETLLRHSAEPSSLIDFDDMLWLPVVHNLPLVSPSFVFVDEAQDLNPIQHELLRRMATPSTRFIFVGDPNQAIYAFRGADADSMERLTEAFNAVTLPLSVSFRCSKAVVAEAQKYISE